MSGDLPNERLLEKELDRLSILAALYEFTDGDERISPEAEEILRQSGVEEMKGQKALQYLEGEKLIRGYSHNASGRRVFIKISITHLGVVEWESILKDRKNPTQHFQIQVIQHFYRDVATVQNGKNKSEVFLDNRK